MQWLGHARSVPITANGQAFHSVFLSRTALNAQHANVYDAGNKEEEWDGEPTPPQRPPAGSPYEAAQKHRRFQVYVHSKMMIVDDEV